MFRSTKVKLAMRIPVEIKRSGLDKNTLKALGFDSDSLSIHRRNQPLKLIKKE
jgi:hypothetical protein